MRGLIHFVHGRENGPWSTKFRAMAAVAKARGWQTDSIDYTRTLDPAERLCMLIRACAAVATPLILVGSSVGAWVAARAACHLPVQRVFLLAGDFSNKDGPESTPSPTVPMEIVHGWQDAVNPAVHAIRYARECSASLHLIDDDHCLGNSVVELCQLFDAFLARA